MSPIPEKLREELANDPYYQVCARLKDGDCEGRITWEHAWIYAGKQIQERWAIIPLCWHHHLGAGLEKPKNQYIALMRATPAELAKYPNKNWAEELRRLKLFYKEEKQRTIQQNRALHKFCKLLSDAYNEKGLSWNEILKNFTMELYPTPESVKEIIIRTPMKRMFHKKSTTQLARSGEIDKLVDVITKFNAQMGIEYIPFPSADLEAEQAGKAIAKV